MSPTNKLQLVHRQFHAHNLILNPISAFLKKLMIPKAFLDGIQGVLVSISSFIYVFLKYAYLWEFERAAVSTNNAMQTDPCRKFGNIGLTGVQQ